MSVGFKIALCVYGVYAKWRKSSEIKHILVNNRTTRKILEALFLP
jgi:hypothetical protein